MPECFHKGHFVPIPALLPSERVNTEDHPSYKSRRLRKPFTEISILPELKFRAHYGTKDKKGKLNKLDPSNKRIYKKFLDGSEGQWLQVMHHNEKQDSPSSGAAEPHKRSAEAKKSEKMFPEVNNRGLLGNA